MYYLGAHCIPLDTLYGWYNIDCFLWYDTLTSQFNAPRLGWSIAPVDRPALGACALPPPIRI